MPFGVCIIEDNIHSRVLPPMGGGNLNTDHPVVALQAWHASSVLNNDVLHIHVSRYIVWRVPPHNVVDGSVKYGVAGRSNFLPPFAAICFKYKI